MISGDHFLHLARTWHNSDLGEPVWRTSTSRAYYGIYHLSRAFIHDFLGIQYRGPNGRGHEYVREILGKTGNDDAKEAASLLASLHEDRKGSDYDIDKPRCATQKKAEHSYLLAEKIKSHLRDARRADSDAMTEAVKKWLKQRYGV